MAVGDDSSGSDSGSDGELDLSELGLSALDSPKPDPPSDDEQEEEQEEEEEEVSGSLTVVVPEGVGAGDTILLETESGEVEVEVPEGLSAGDEFGATPVAIGI